MRTNNHEEEQREKMVDELISDRTSISRNCYKLIKETDLFQHCSRVIFSHDICDPPFCSCYTNPISKWRVGDCPMADTFLKTNYVPPKEKKKVGHIKKRKKSRR